MASYGQGGDAEVTAAEQVETDLNLLVGWCSLLAQAVRDPNRHPMNAPAVDRIIMAVNDLADEIRRITGAAIR